MVKILRKSLEDRKAPFIKVDCFACQNSIFRHYEKQNVKD